MDLRFNDFVLLAALLALAVFCAPLLIFGAVMYLIYFFIKNPDFLIGLIFIVGLVIVGAMTFLNGGIF